jgi:hypothetical protein
MVNACALRLASLCANVKMGTLATRARKHVPVARHALATANVLSNKGLLRVCADLGLPVLGAKKLAQNSATAKAHAT